MRLKQLGVGHIFAVKGPRDAGYNAAEVGNSKLAAKLVAGGNESLAKKAPFIFIAAHSSAHTDQDPNWKIAPTLFESTLALSLRDQDAFDRGVGAG